MWNLEKPPHFGYVYKTQKQWKNYLVKRIMEIEEQRHDEVVKMIGHRII